MFSKRNDCSFSLPQYDQVSGTVIGTDKCLSSTVHLFTQAPFDFELSFNICQIQQAAILNIIQFKNLNEFCWVNIYFVFIHCKIRQRSEVT